MMNGFDFATLVFVAGVTCLALLSYALGVIVGTARGTARGVSLGVGLAGGVTTEAENDEPR